MACQLILKELKSGSHDQIAQNVHDYLAPVLDDKYVGLADRAVYGLSAVKILHTSLECVTSGKLSTNLLDAVHCCYQGYKNTRNDVKLNEPLTVLKLLYHLLAKLPHKGYTESLLSFSYYLYDELSEVDASQLSGTVTTIIQNTYSMLWNIAVKQEQDSEYTAALRLRHAALKVLLLSQNSINTVMKKLLLAVNRYDKMIAQFKNNKQSKDDVLLSLQLTQNLLVLSGEHCSSTMDDETAYSVLSVHMYLMKFTLQHNQTVDCITLLQKMSSKTLPEILQLYVAVQKLYHVVSVVTKSTLKSKSKNSEINTLHLMKDLPNTFGENWSPSWYTLLQELFLSMFKYLGAADELLAVEVMCELVQVVVVFVTFCVEADTQNSEDKGPQDKNCVDLTQLTLRTIYKYLQDCKDNTTFNPLVEKALSMSEIYNTLLESDKHEWSDKIRNQERHYCGYLMSKMGHLCCSHGNDNIAITFYTISCQQLSTWAQSDMSLRQQRVEEVSLWRVYECLADCQKKCGDLDGSMNTVVMCLLVDSSHMTSAVKLWVRAKKELIKEGKSDFEKSVLGLHIQNKVQDNSLDVIGLLLMELQAFRKFRNRHYEAELSILNAVLKVAKCPCVRARTLLDIGQIIWLSGISDDKSISHYTQEAAKLLQRANNSEACIILAEICIWQYIIEHEEACQKVQVLSEQELLQELKTANDTESEPGEESDPSQTNSSQSKVMFTLNMELVAMEKLRKALELWENVLSDQYVLDNKTDHNALFSCFLLCSNILRLSRQINQERRLLNLALKMAENYTDLDAAAVSSRLEQISLLVGDIPQPGEYMSSMACSMSVHTLTELQGIQRDAALQALMLKAEGLLHTEQVDDGISLLSDLLTFVETQSCKSRSVCMAEGTAKRLMSMFLGLPGSQDTNTSNLYALDLAIDAVRMHTGVLQFLLGKAFLTGVAGGHSLDKWNTVSEVLQSLLHVGQMYILIGEVREAKCYLMEGWKLSHYMCLPRWTGTFLLEISKVHSLCGEREEQINTLRDIHHIYSGKTMELAMVVESKSKKTVRSKIGQEKKSKRKLSENFGFQENVNSIDCADLDGTINTLKLIPSCFDHVTQKKSCDICDDFLFTSGLLSTVLCICQCEIDVGNFDSAENNLKNVKLACDSLVSEKSVQYSEKSNVKSVKKKGCKEVSLANSICYNIKLKALFLETSNLMSRCSLYEGDIGKCAEITQQNIDKSLNMFKGTSFQTCHLKAELHLYLVHCHYEFLSVSSQVKKDLTISMLTEAEDISESVDKVASNMSRITLEENFEEHKIPDALEDEERDTKSQVQQDVVLKGNIQQAEVQATVKSRTRNKKNGKTEQEGKKNATANEKMKIMALEKKPRGKVDKLIVENNNCTTPTKQKTVGLNCDVGFSATIRQHYMFSDEQGCSMLPFKTPRSVCSRKAGLHLLLDDSDEEVEESTTKRGRGKRGGKSSQPARKNILSKNDKKDKSMKAPVLSLKETLSSNSTESPQTGSAGNGKGKSRIPCPVRKPKVQEIEAPQEQETDVKLEAVPATKTKRTAIRKNGVISNRAVGGRGGKSGSNKNMEIEHERENKECEPQPKHLTNSYDIYDFDEIDDPSDTKVKSTKTKQASKVKRMTNHTAKVTEKVKGSVQANRKLIGRRIDSQERARSETEMVKDRRYVLDDSFDDIAESIELTMHDESLDIENDHSRTVVSSLDLLTFVNEMPDDLDNFDIQKEELVKLDDSIEILRGGDQAKKKPTTTKKGRSKKKLEPGETSECDQQDVQKPGETTEVMRSTQGFLKSQGTEAGSTQLDQFKAVTDVTTSEVRIPEDLNHTVTSTLEKAFHQIQHFPSCGLYNTICNMLALQLLESSPLDAVFYLCEAMAVTFRHQALTNTGKKLRKLKRQQTTADVTDGPSTDIVSDSITVKEKSSQNLLGQETSINDLQLVQDKLRFSKTSADLQKLLKQVPEGMVICQISMVTHAKQPASLLISRMESGQEPVAVNLPGFSSIQGQQILPEFSAIMEESKLSMKVTGKTEWWKTRRQLDDRMHAVLDSLERHWLGHWKVLLLGNPTTTKEEKIKLKTVTEIISSEIYKTFHVRPSVAKLQLLLQSAQCLTDHQLSSALSELTGHPPISPTVKQMKIFVREQTEDVDLCSQGRKRQHVVLVLDKAVQHLPWENIPVLRNHSASRLPSFYYMCMQLSYLQGKENSILHRGIDSRNTLYILNPDNNLMSTQETFQSWFEKEDGWKGFVGVKPTSEQFKEALTQRDLLLYCGHGSGSKYFHGDDLQQVSCQAAAILMGCSSGRLQVRGQLEASGMMLNYFLSGCPCIVANLWDVTDRDIDRFLESLLTTWMSADKPSRLQDVIYTARQACRLPYLIGSAPVMYGFPVYLAS